MKLGVNSDVNIEQKPVRIKHNLGPSKVDHYNQKAKSPKKSEETESITMKPPKAKVQTQKAPKDVDGFNSQHKLNLALIRWFSLLHILKVKIYIFFLMHQKYSLI